MEDGKKSSGMYITLGDGEILIHVPCRVVVDEIEKHGAHGIYFTKRERQVLERIILAKSNKEIASEIGICERTVKFHVSEILRKTQCSSRTAVALRYGGKA